MAATFDATLPTDVDWVRLQIADTASPFRLQNETIAAVLAASVNKWFAAAELLRLSLIHVTDDKVTTRIVDDLHLSFGGKTSDSYLSDHEKRLREMGAWQASTGPKLFEVLSDSDC